MDKPNGEDKCGNPNCGHAFSQHYTTYGGHITGCSNQTSGQRMESSCYCKGFLIVYKYPAELSFILPDHPPGVR